MKKLKLIFLITVLLITAVYLSLFMTGRVERSYDVLPETSIINLGDRKLSLENFASEYKPNIFTDPKNEKQKILWTWYEVVENKDSYDIVYYNCWENEKNPYKSFDFIYKIFRVAYFGYPLYDIEYILIKVNKQNGKIVRCNFETSIYDNYNQKVVKHYLSELTNIDSLQFQETIINKDEKRIVESHIYNYKNDTKKISLGIKTWNHMLCAVHNSNASRFSKLCNSDILYLNNSDYKKYKFCRKSQSEHLTKDNFLHIIGIATILFGIFISPILIKKRSPSNYS